MGRVDAFGSTVLKPWKNNIHQCQFFDRGLQITTAYLNRLILLRGVPGFRKAYEHIEATRMRHIHAQVDWNSSLRHQSVRFSFTHARGGRKQWQRTTLSGQT